MTYEEWGTVFGGFGGDAGAKLKEMMYADWTDDREQLLSRIKEYEAFNAPLRRTYNKNTAEEATP